MKTALLTLLATLLTLCPLLADSFQTTEIKLPLPQLQGWPQPPQPTSASFTGIVYPADQAAITADSHFAADSPFALFTRLLAAYKAKDLAAIRALYNAPSQLTIDTMLETIGDKAVLDAVSYITSLTPRVFWLDSPRTGIFYMSAADSGSVMPFIITREEGQWRFVSGSLNSQLALAFDLVNSQKLWASLHPKPQGNEAGIDVAQTLESGTFTALPKLDARD